MDGEGETQGNSARLVGVWPPLCLVKWEDDWIKLIEAVSNGKLTYIHGPLLEDAWIVIVQINHQLIN